ncbi:hypothetical protein Tco_1178854, partial [Tanacetum coccineum]
IRWHKKIFPLPQGLMSKLFQSRHGCLLGKAMAFTALANVPAIYIQQFWNTLECDSKSGIYNFQIDELWFELNVNLLHKALDITPKDTMNPFVPPLAGYLIMDFVNELGYPKETSSSDKTRHPILQMLWGVVTQTNVDYAELMWEESVQVIKTFFADAANLKSSRKKPSKPKPHFVPKGEKDEVFGMAIPKDLITEAIQNSEYYDKYVEMAGKKKAQKVDESKQASKSKKPAPAKKPAPVKKPKPAKEPVPTKEKASKPYPSNKACKGKLQKICKGQDPMHLVDEVYEECQPALEPQIDENKLNLQRGIQMSLEAFETQGQARQAPVGGVVIRESASVTPRLLLDVQGKGKAIATDEQVAQSLLELQKLKRINIAYQFILQRRILGTPDVTLDTSTGPYAQPHDDTSANVVHDTYSPTNVETSADTESFDSEDTKILEVAEEKGDDVYEIVALKERTAEFDEGHAGSDPGRTPESRAQPEVEDEVHESLKHADEEHVFLENPPSSSRTLSSMKNLDDDFTFGDQFIADKSPEKEPGKATIDTKAESMVTIPIHQASSSAPPLSSDSGLAARVLELKKRCAELEQKNKTLENTTKNLGSRVFMLELRDLPHKIDQTVNEVVNDVVQTALQTPLRERFIDLPEADRKEILH